LTQVLDTFFKRYYRLNLETGMPLAGVTD